jgi:hypothetical protein
MISIIDTNSVLAVFFPISCFRLWIEFAMKFAPAAGSQTGCTEVVESAVSINPVGTERRSDRDRRRALAAPAVPQLS